MRRALPRHRGLPVLVALGFASLASAAQAGDRGSEADQDACRADVFRLCMAAIPDESAIVACLNTRHLELTAACRHVIDPEPQKQHKRAASSG